MTKIIRIIWRLDYEASYDFLDRRGTALRILQETEKDFFSQTADGNVINSFIGERRDSIGYRMVSIEPTSMSGSIEWDIGIEIDSVLTSDYFRSSDKICNAFCREFNLRQLKRAGLRTIGVGSKSPALEGLGSAGGWINNQLEKCAVKTLGSIKDVGLVLEGDTDDGLSYRSNFGPLAIKNIDANLSNPKTDIRDKIFSKFDLFFDIDIYELNFNFVAGSLHRWSKTKFDKGRDFVDTISITAHG